MSAKNRPSDLKPLKAVEHAIVEEDKDQDNSDQRNQKNVVGFEDSVYGRFTHHVLQTKLERDDFCRPIHIYITMEELQDFFSAVNFPISKDEVFLIFKDHNAHKTGYLPMDEFYKRLRCWQNYQPKDYTAIEEEANKLLNRNTGNNITNNEKKRPTTAVVAGAKNLRAMTAQGSRSRLESANKMGKEKSEQREVKIYAEDKTKHYLKLAKQKKEEEERALALTIDKGKRETEFDCLHKMGEACELAKMLNVPISFSAFKGPDGSLKIHFFQFIEDTQKRIVSEEDDEDQNAQEMPMKEIKREISMKEFYREYRKLKRMQNSVKNNYTH